MFRGSPGSVAQVLSAEVSLLPSEVLSARGDPSWAAQGAP